MPSVPHDGEYSLLLSVLISLVSVKKRRCGSPPDRSRMRTGCPCGNGVCLRLPRYAVLGRVNHPTAQMPHQVHASSLLASSTTVRAGAPQSIQLTVSVCSMGTSVTCRPHMLYEPSILACILLSSSPCMECECPKAGMGVRICRPLASGGSPRDRSQVGTGSPFRELPICDR